MNTKRLLLLFILAMEAACSSPPACKPPAAKEDIVYVMEQGWHAEIGIPVNELDGDLAFLRKTYKGAKVVMFGYGKKTFFTAPAHKVSEYMLGPVPGPAVIQTVGLSVLPQEAYPDDEVVTLTLPRGGKDALLAYIWDDFTRDASDKPQVVAHSHNPDGLFYMAESEYTLFHTCNSWTAEVLQHAGLPISSGGVMLSHQVMDQVRALSQKQCVTDLP